LISCCCFFAALLILQKLAFKMKLSTESRLLLPWIVCFFPTSYFFSTPITEALFFLLLVSSWYLVLIDRVILAGIIFSLVGLTRPTGPIAFPAFLILLYEARQLFTKKGLLAAFLAPLGTAAFMLFMWEKTGNPLAFSDNQKGWGRGAISFSHFIS